MGTCIWCKKTTCHEPVEHIIPDSLGCPTDMVLRDDEVCAKCNHGFSRLDQALISEFEIPRFMAGVPTKGGHAPKIATRPNMRGETIKDVRHLDVNMERHAVITPDGRRIGGRTGRPQDVDMEMSRVGSVGHVTIRQGHLCNSKLAVRALHKVGFELFAKHHGLGLALDMEFEAVRAFVRRGIGERIVVMAPMADRFEFQNQVFRNDGATFDRAVQAFRIAFVGFLVDLSSDQRHVVQVKDRCRRHLGERWTWAPIK